jgi:hypothetical protein
LEELNNDYLLPWCEASAIQTKVPYTHETIQEQWLKENYIRYLPRILNHAKPWSAV